MHVQFLEDRMKSFGDIAILKWRNVFWLGKMGPFTPHSSKSVGRIFL